MKALQKLVGYFTILVAMGMILSCEKEEKMALEVSATSIKVVNPKSVFTVTSNTPWGLRQEGNYTFTISPTRGFAGSTEVSILYSANTGDTDRSATVTIVSEDNTLYKTIAISQPSLKFSLSTTKLEFENTESTKSIEVTSNTSWSINKNNIPDWIKDVKVSGETGNGKIDITVKQSTNRGGQNACLLKVIYDGSLSKSIEIIQAPALNKAPGKPIIQAPANNATGVDIFPEFSWMASTDPENDPIKYTVQISEDGENWSNFEAGEVTYATLPHEIGFLKKNTTYFYKVIADDLQTDGITESDVYKFTTTSSTTTYKDGEYVLHMNSPKAEPFILIFTGEGYLAEHFEKGGLFDQNVNHAIDAFFEIEPYRSYKEYFKVYKIAAYSKQTGITNAATNYNRDTKFELVWNGGNSTHISRPDKDYQPIFDWCKKIPEVKTKGFLNTAIGVIINDDIYAGTCAMFGDGRSIAMIPYKKNGKGQTKFANTLRHEMAGHGFGRLADEYIYENATLPDDERKDIIAWQETGGMCNVSVESNIANSPWSHFVGVEGYSHVKMYEGADLYKYGIWRPEYISCMQDNRAYFNSPSRFYIVKRILEAAGEVTPVYSTDSESVKDSKIKKLMNIFVPKDIQKTDNSSAYKAEDGWGGVPYDFVPLGRPILIWE